MCRQALEAQQRFAELSRSRQGKTREEEWAAALRWLAKGAAKAPVYLYRFTLSPLIGQRCRYLPTCSNYALDAIELNGAWAGFWLASFRFFRCHPWGASGFDPAPDLSGENIPFWAVWRYSGRGPRG
jgi:putative membrane protein insertion efficiency factor